MGERAAARLCGALALAAGTLLAAALAHLGLPVGSHPGPTVAARLAESGVTQPVTAVLLNFRALDTLLEAAVLAAAAGAVGTPAQRPARLGDAGPVARWLFHLLLPAALLAGGYLWWAGTSRAGGAFQAGVTLAAALLLAWQAGRSGPLATAPGQAAAAAGPLLFLLAGLAALVRGEPFLTWPPALAGAVIVAIEAALALAVAAALTLLVQAPGRR